MLSGKSTFAASFVVLLTPAACGGESTAACTGSMRTLSNDESGGMGGFATEYQRLDKMWGRPRRSRRRALAASRANRPSTGPTGRTVRATLHAQPAVAPPADPPSVELASPCVPPSVAPPASTRPQVVTSAGHVAATPSQVSSRSHAGSVDARHEIPADTTPSGGHAGEAPRQTSARSHAPVAARHSTPLKNSLMHAPVPEQWSGASQMPMATEPHACVTGA